MSIVIQKFGGKLLQTAADIKRAALFIISTRESGDNPVVVVSAPGGMTDKFISMAHEISDHPDMREMDMLLSVGERTAMALLAMAINEDGRFRAVSFTGSQIGIITDTKHTDARVIEVKCLRIRETLERGEIPIVAGFQGVSTDKEITTLGRGGSDVTAVAIAAALKAERCELIKEVGALHSADPVLVPGALELGEIDYSTLESLTAAGAKVVQPRAAALAKNHNVTLSITDVQRERGTIITDRSLEIGKVAGIVLVEGVHVEWLSPEFDPLGKLGDYFLLTFENERWMVVSKEGHTIESKKADLVTVIGWSGSLPFEVGKEVRNVLEDAGIVPLAFTGHCEKLSMVVDESEGKKASQIIHEMCIEKGFIKPQP